MVHAELKPAGPDEDVHEEVLSPAPGGAGREPPHEGADVGACSPSERWERDPLSAFTRVGWFRPWHHEQWIGALGHQSRGLWVCQMGFWCLSSGVLVLFVLMVVMSARGDLSLDASHLLAAVGVACATLDLAILHPWLVLSGRHRHLQEALVTQGHVEAWEQSPLALDYLHRLGGTTVPLLVGDVYRLTECYNQDVAAGLMQAREVVPSDSASNDPLPGDEPLAQAA